jgi:hypothetical protein
VIEGDVPERRAGAIIPAIISTYEPTRVVVSAHADRPGYLVLTDTLYPGWRAEVDGRPAPIYRANSLFRAVRLEPGSHTATFTYEPDSFRWGTMVSALTVLGIVVAMLMPIGRRRLQTRLLPYHVGSTAISATRRRERSQ